MTNLAWKIKHLLTMKYPVLWEQTVAYMCRSIQHSSQPHTSRVPAAAVFTVKLMNAKQQLCCMCCLSDMFPMHVFKSHVVFTSVQRMGNKRLTWRSFFFFFLHRTSAKVSCCLAAGVSQTLHTECTGSTSFVWVTDATWWREKKKKQHFNSFPCREKEGCDKREGSLTSVFSLCYSSSGCTRGPALRRLLACYILRCHKERGNWMWSKRALLLY